MSETSLFLNEPFLSHGGTPLSFKIECDALSEEDIETLAHLVSRGEKFRRVYGIPRGGMRLAQALEKHRSPAGNTIIVDDVFTTGTSMRRAREEVGNDSFGVVIFARHSPPSWIRPIFTLSSWVGR